MIQPILSRKTSQGQCSPDALLLSQCLAKTIKTTSGEKLPGRLVLEHCRIVGEVARAILARMPDKFYTSLFPQGSELVAAAHDVGKVCPTFQEKIYRGTDDYVRNSLAGLEQANPEVERQWGGHAGVSYLASKALAVGKYIPEIIGQHHGYSPNPGGKLASDALFGGSEWQARRKELLEALKTAFIQDWPQVNSSNQARVLAGLTTVADWVGSGSLFDDPDQSWQPLIEQALDRAGFLQPELQSELSFQEVFGFHPHDAQQGLFENCTKPGIYILEAPMGLGKTEAALYAAYQAITSGNATGFYFALPTQLTSDRIHTRVNKFLTRILEPTSQHSRALLLHGNAWLNATEMGEDGQPGGSWFQSSKRGILAPFAVGTIDQALMAAMNVKHGFVRTFGLAGKVVILDEVHSYDAYTGTILDRLVKTLRELDCTVIILSATLNQQRRQELLNQPSGDNSYPLISALPRGGAFQEVSVQPMNDAQVLLQMHQSDKQAIEEALIRAEQGQQVFRNNNIH